MPKDAYPVEQEDEEESGAQRKEPELEAQNGGDGGVPLLGNPGDLQEDVNVHGNGGHDENGQGDHEEAAGVVANLGEAIGAKGVTHVARRSSVDRGDKRKEPAEGVIPEAVVPHPLAQEDNALFEKENKIK